LTRTASGPVNLATPGQATRPTSLIGSSTSGLPSTGRKVGGAQRIRREDVERQRREVEEQLALEAEERERERARKAIEEKENAYATHHESRYSPLPSSSLNSRPIHSLPSRTNFHGISRVGRPLVSAKKLPTVSKIAEHETDEAEADNGGEFGEQLQQHYYQQHRNSNEGKTAESQGYVPRTRSVPPHKVPLPASRPNSVHGAPSRARRVTLEEKLRQEQEIANEEARGE
jgi:Sec-independent protein translocase protein TatA